MSCAVIMLKGKSTTSPEHSETLSPVYSCELLCMDLLYIVEPFL
jgi:hypothetical protein